MLLGALTLTHWNKSAAAASLHGSCMTLYRKLHKYRIEEPPAKPGHWEPRLQVRLRATGARRSRCAPP